MHGFFLIFLIGVLVLILFYSYRYGITPTPTSIKVKKKLMTMLPKMTNIEIAELGSGWGNLAYALSCQFPTCKVTGYEISPIPYTVSKVILYLIGCPNLFIKRQDFFQVSLERFSLIVCYLYPEAMRCLKDKFEKELAPRTYIISHTFAVPGWIPIRFECASDLYHTPIYLYQI